MCDPPESVCGCGRCGVSNNGGIIVLLGGICGLKSGCGWFISLWIEFEITGRFCW